MVTILSLALALALPLEIEMPKTILSSASMVVVQLLVPLRILVASYCEYGYDYEYAWGKSQ